MKREVGLDIGLIHLPGRLHLLYSSTHLLNIRSRRTESRALGCRGFDDVTNLDDILERATSHYHQVGERLRQTVYAVIDDFHTFAMNPLNKSAHFHTTDSLAYRRPTDSKEGAHLALAG